jgi:nucleotide-binding universal stress UspA family protein
MFRHILVPTDGSSLAAKGVNSGVRLAKALATLEREARQAGVRCTKQVITAPQPWQGILKVACVLAHSKIPLLVIR